MHHWNYKSHRFGPAPIHWNSEPGVCCWCGCCILTKKGKPNFKRWHHACFEEFSRLFWPAKTRRFIHKLRGDFCEICRDPISIKRYEPLRDENGKRILDLTNNSAKWKYKKHSEHHHIIQLIDYCHTIEDPWAAWRPANIILLCHDCHMEEHRKLRELKNKQLNLFG